MILYNRIAAGKIGMTIEMKTLFENAVVTDYKKYPFHLVKDSVSTPEKEI